MTALLPRRPATPAAIAIDDVGAEIRRLRAEASVRVSEVDLLVAALRDHVRDLQRERDWLRGELEESRSRHALSEASWLHRGLKGAH